MKKLAAILASAMLLGGFLSVWTPAAPAHAALRNCSIQAHPILPNEGRMSYCDGSGEHRVVLRCNEGRLWGNPDFTVYGAWVSAGKYSGATCLLGKVSGFYRSASLQTRS